MSYDLYFYKKKDNELTEQAFANYLTKTIPFNDKEYPKQWFYEHPDTGVYFSIDWDDPNTDQEDIEIWDSFDDFEYLNFSFNINFFRPGYFGMEGFPIIERIVEELDLYILNPQEFEEQELPQKFENGHLQAQWSSDNDRLSIQQFDELKFKFMPPDKSNYIWWFQLHRQEIENSLTEDIFVPNIFIIQSKHDGKLYTACVWPDHIPLILPSVDYVIIKRKRKKLFKTVEESGLVEYVTITEELITYFETFDCPVPNLKVLKQRNADRIADEFNKLEIFSSVNDFGIGVGLDGFVNAKPD